MSSQKVTSQCESSTVISRKANLEEVQQVLDEIGASITKYRFTPEQVFGYRGKAAPANVPPPRPRFIACHRFRDQKGGAPEVSRSIAHALRQIDEAETRSQWLSE
ncbi:hypothetical protein [Burkholderia vietnamiensis]|uniref:hypothetical protein n=1 Tax=Burkholderia vietnamiensis TaxID=60552 RepID=UPI001B928F29|nr:hypothetical protein [Burkholderia vietnamiensis]MBR8219720.1 hypothetical protein [Burkholderia vietnamiensis]